MRTAISYIVLFAAAYGQFVAGAYNKGAASSNPSIIQSANCDTTVSSNTCTATFGQTVGAGHYLICYAAGTGNSTGASCTMTGETLTKRSGTTGCTNAAGYEADCYTSNNTAGGQTAITCTMSTGSAGLCEFAEVSSPSGGHAIDAGGNAHATTTAFSVSTSAATTNAGDICIAMGYNGNASGPFTALSWTSQINTSVTDGTLIMQYTLPGSTGTETATATATSGVTNMPEGVLCLKP